MAPTMPVSAPLAGGSKNAIAPCVATRSLRMRCVSVACSPGVATSSRQRTEPTCQDSCSKEKLPGILTASSCLTSGYQLSNEHIRTHILHLFSHSCQPDKTQTIGYPSVIKLKSTLTRDELWKSGLVNSQHS